MCEKNCSNFFYINHEHSPIKKDEDLNPLDRSVQHIALYFIDVTLSANIAVTNSHKYYQNTVTVCQHD